MSAPTGNLNAEKWSVEALLPLLDELEERATQTEVHFIGSLLVKFRISRKAWSYWRRKFADHPEISPRMEIIEDILEQRLVEDALDGKIKPAVAMFCLKCHHEWPSPGPSKPEPGPGPEPEPEAPPPPPKVPDPEPITVEMPDGSVLIFPFNSGSSGIPPANLRNPESNYQEDKPG